MATPKLNEIRVINGRHYQTVPGLPPKEQEGDGACTGCGGLVKRGNGGTDCHDLGNCYSVRFIEVVPAPTTPPGGLPTDAAARKAAPVFSGCLAYFPLALAEVARVSVTGAKQHNLEGLSFVRNKSTDHGDCVVRHQMEFDKIDTDGHYHAAKVAWRALAQLQVLLETPK